ARLPPGVLVLSLLREGTVVHPRGDTVVAAGDRLTVLAARGREAEVRRYLTGRRGTSPPGSERLRAQVAGQGVGHLDRPVRALVVLDQRRDRARERQRAAVQGVDRLRPALAVHAPRASPRAQAVRLERLEVADARDLEPAALARAPDLQVVLLRLREAQVAG